MFRDEQFLDEMWARRSGSLTQEKPQIQQVIAALDAQVGKARASRKLIRLPARSSIA
jgi:hypothetical protein